MIYLPCWLFSLPPFFLFYPTRREAPSYPAPSFPLTNGPKLGFCTLCFSLIPSFNWEWAIGVQEKIKFLQISSVCSHQKSTDPRDKVQKKAYRLKSFHFYHHFCNGRYPSLIKPFFGLISKQISSILHFIDGAIPYLQSATNTSKKHIRMHKIDNVRLYSSLILGFYRKSKFRFF